MFYDKVILSISWMKILCNDITQLFQDLRNINNNTILIVFYLSLYRYNNLVFKMLLDINFTALILHKTLECLYSLKNNLFNKTLVLNSFITFEI